MKNSSRWLALLLALAMVCSIVGCTPAAESQTPAEEAPASATEAPAEEAPVAQEPVVAQGEGSAMGFGGTISVKVTVTDGVLTEVTATGDKETVGIGSRAVEELPAQIVAANSIDIDGISGATVSSTALFEAAKAAYAQATGTSATAAKMKAGTYTSTGNGYGGPLDVEVTVSEDAIQSVTITQQAETISIGSHAVEMLPADIVENQSVGVDIISGASVTSNAIRSAVRDCLTQAGADMQVYARPIVPEKTNEVTTLDCDVVVVGAGLAGLTAASQACDQGLNVVVLEKLSITGGCAKTSLGTFMVAQVPENAEFALNEEMETLDDILAHWKALSDTSIVPNDEFPNYDRLRFMLVETLHTTNLFQKLGASFKRYNMTDMISFRVSVDGYNGTGAGQLLQLMEDYVRNSGAVILTDTPADKLIINEDQQVRGVHATGKTGEVVVNAKQVILATGGFAANEEMMAELIPTVPEYNTITSPGNVGDGMTMALEAGAALLEHQWIHNSRPGYTKNLKSHSQYIIALQHDNSPFEDEYEDPYARLVVDKDGARFENEGASYSTQDISMLVHNNFPYWVIFSNLDEFLSNVADQGIPSGEVFKADTLAELAELMGADPATFEAACARYDEMVAAGEDTDFGKDPMYLTNPVGTEGPFYAIHLLLGSNDTLGGVKTTYDYEAVREDGSVIDGLYAVGSMSNGHYYNQYYLSGSQLTFAATSGRLAVESIVKKLAEAK